MFSVAMISAVISDRYGCRGYIFIFFSLCNIVGFVMFYGASCTTRPDITILYFAASKSYHVRYGSLFLTISGNYAGAPPVITWITNNSAPHIRRATAVAIAFIMTNSGGILATWLLGFLSPAPNYTKATVTFIIMSVAMLVLSCINLAYLSHQNRLKAQRRQQVALEDEPEGLGDKSAWFIYNL